VSEPDPYPGPNEEVLEAQVRVCTGPHQSRPLGKKEGDPDPKRILELILASLKGALPGTAQVSPAQMGAFFAAMSIRRTFGTQTGWSAAELEAFDRYGAALSKMPEDLRFLLGMAPDFVGCGTGEARVVAALRSVLPGGHLSYEEVRAVLGAMLAGQVRPALMAAFLIGQRMNIENEEEARAHLDAVRYPQQVLRVQADSLLHFGQPFDGAARYFRPTLFVAAVRAALGRATVLHGVDEMPPKRGVTEEGVLAALGARVDLPLATAARCIEDPTIGFAYVSQREYAPGAYALRHLRTHIAKRPPWATTEKAQRLFVGAAWNGMVTGFYHAGYEDKLLGLMRNRGLDAGLVIKGEEGSSHYGLRLGKPSDARRRAINYVQGFRRVGSRLEPVAGDVDPAEYGFCYEQSPRPAEVSARAFAAMGLAALKGAQGHVYDRIALNVGLTDYYLGLSASAEEGLAAAREAMDSGRALAHLERYIKRSGD